MNIGCRDKSSSSYQKVTVHYRGEVHHGLAEKRDFTEDRGIRERGRETTPGCYVCVCGFSSHSFWT